MAAAHASRAVGSWLICLYRHDAPLTAGRTNAQPARWAHRVVALPTAEQIALFLVMLLAALAVVIGEAYSRFAPKPQVALCSAVHGSAC